MSLMLHIVITAVVISAATALVVAGAIAHATEVSSPGLLLAMAGQASYWDARTRWQSAVDELSDTSSERLRSVS